MATPPNDLVAQLATPAFGSVSLLSVNDLRADERNALPEWWLDVLHREGSDAVTRVLAEWEFAVPEFASQFLQRLRSDGIGVYLGGPARAWRWCMPSRRPLIRTRTR